MSCAQEQDLREQILLARRSLKASASRPLSQLTFIADEGIRRGVVKVERPWSRESRIRKLELHVFPWNEPALGLYESFGFVREGYRKRHYERGGELVDAILMAYFVED